MLLSCVGRSGVVSLCVRLDLSGEVFGRSCFFFSGDMCLRGYLSRSLPRSVSCSFRCLLGGVGDPELLLLLLLDELLCLLDLLFLFVGVLLFRLLLLDLGFSSCAVAVFPSLVMFSGCLYQHFSLNLHLSPYWHSLFFASVFFSAGCFHLFLLSG